MRRGLVIGKFLPIHNGHIALIDFAASQCDELIVSMSYTAQDPIDVQLRFSWIKKIFENRPRIKVELSEDDFDDESLPLEARTKLWASFIRNRFPPVMIVFSSEEYGYPFALNLNAEHVIFDQPRTKIPVSGTLIRNNPFQYWDYIPTVVRPYFVKTICFYGPESTGKSYMSKHMAAVYNTEFLPEVARELITSNEFSVNDIIQIGKAQTARIVEKKMLANKILFCDTDVITTQIYSQRYLGEVPAILYELENQIQYDQYFLFHTDVPWVADDLRDLGDKRTEMFQIFKAELDKRNINYINVRESWAQREKTIQEVIDNMLSGNRIIHE